jgi:FkbM family methyltransferase
VRIYAFEPNPANFNVLLETKARNHLGALLPQNIGLSDAAENMTLTVEGASSGHSTFGVNPEFDFKHGEFAKHDIPLESLDVWASNRGVALAPMRTVVKMDIEGFELRALKGMKAALDRKAFSAIIVEVCEHTLRFCSTCPMELAALLGNYGYWPHDVFLKPTRILHNEFRNLVFLPGSQPAGPGSPSCHL